MISRLPQAEPTGWRNSKWLALVELGIVVLMFVADSHHLVPFSKTPFLLVLAWISLRLRRLRWRDIGFFRNRSWGATLGIGIGAGLGLELFQLHVTQPLLVRLTGKQPDLSDFAALTGNIKLTLILLVLAWTLAAFGEEVVWRGYLMNRVAGLGGRGRVAWICSLLVVNITFGVSHSDQGLTGQIEESIAGVALGAMYLGSGSLAVPIVAHGVSDTLDFVLIYLGKYPGM